ncbi:MAG: hypothetical protein KDD69_04105, partial [Bdellovibrionales bacterium]|nr:hypothetical protein [Bdellovibrionales bacterium]
GFAATWRKTHSFNLSAKRFISQPFQKEPNELILAETSFSACIASTRLCSVFRRKRILTPQLTFLIISIRNVRLFYNL